MIKPQKIMAILCGLAVLIAAMGVFVILNYSRISMTQEIVLILIAILGLLVVIGVFFAIIRGKVDKT